MAGLVPAIHVFRVYASEIREDVDARHKAGHDAERVDAPALNDNC
jgi:hypothetical protein